MLDIGGKDDVCNDTPGSRLDVPNTEGVFDGMGGNVDAAFDFGIAFADSIETPNTVGILVGIGGK